MARRESWAESRRPTAAEIRKAKQLLARPGFPPQSDAYANVLSKKERKEKADVRARHAAEAVVDTLVECAERGGCPYCETNEAHLHGGRCMKRGGSSFDPPGLPGPLWGAARGEVRRGRGRVLELERGAQ